jgi:hypothetical protein
MTSAYTKIGLFHRLGHPSQHLEVRTKVLFEVNGNKGHTTKIRWCCATVCHLALLFIHQVGLYINQIALVSNRRQISSVPVADMEK